MLCCCKCGRKAMAKAVNIAAEMVIHANSKGYDLTHMQLQKMVYIAHGIKLAETGDPLLDEPVDAWKYGPVIQPLYAALKQFGSGVVSINKDYSYSGLTSSDIEVIHRTVEQFHKYTGPQLSDLTHKKESPWYKVWYDSDGNEIRGAKIPNNVIRKHYESLIAEGKADAL